SPAQMAKRRRRWRRCSIFQTMATQSMPHSPRCNVRLAKCRRKRRKLPSNRKRKADRASRSRFRSPIICSRKAATIFVIRFARCERLDFKKDPEAARAYINKWVADQTRDKIRDLIPQGGIKELTRLVLANALYLKAPWATEFNDAVP